MGQQEGAGSHQAAAQDGAHLDEDAECLEDPVHCGDAQHQHALHVSTPSATEASTPPATALPDDEGAGH